MLALVTTPRFLLLVDVQRRHVSVIESRRPEYYGVSWRPGSDELILSHSGLDNESLVDLASYAGSEVGWISEGEQESPPFLSQPHQILCGSDGRVICTNTGRNSVVVIDPARPGHFQEARLHRERWDRLDPGRHRGLHLNSLFEHGGQLQVLAHGFDAGSRLFTLTYPGLEPVDETPLAGVTGMHNVCQTASGEHLACVSSRGLLVDPMAGRVWWRSGSGGYLRGLAVGAEQVLIGESPQVGRHLRATAVGCLWVVDRRTWQATDHMVLGPYGVVNEVRLLDEPDEAHHGHPFAGVERLGRMSLWPTLSQARLRASRQLAELTVGPFEIVFGSPVVSDDGWWASPNELCLMLGRSEAPQSLALRYRLTEDVEGAHCGLVIGCGAATDMASPTLRDAEMDVLMAIRSGEHHVALAHWRHDGSTWTRCGVLAEVTGQVGMLRVVRQADAVVIEAGEPAQVVASLPQDAFSWIDDAWGYRWQSTEIMPQTLLAAEVSLAAGH